MIRKLTLLFLSSVFNILLSNAQSVQKEKPEVQSVLSKWSFGLNGGMGYRLFRTGRIITTAANQKYLNDFKSGISFGGNAAYFPWRRAGFGLRYDRYQSKASTVDLTEDVTIQHLSGLLTHRSIVGKRNATVLTSLLMGYQPYQNKATSGDEHFTFTGKTMGWGVSVGIEQRLGQNFGLNLTGTAMMGAIYRMERKTDISTATLHLSKDNSVDLSRFSLTLGFAFLK
ncbi:porin family protein [Dyadobacter arcticus]|uniref:Outer membrane protein beta-barrel domain-containing protein n=1 Tax=Dyadobacter arcticus TaxID=1078754 RepID=A0ABX0UIN5_9BACT|nr:porin family protein [Dyadobacter arcticus]NIJ51944.1 hypothetical protein [Dyadobacter arcticus]